MQFVSPLLGIIAPVLDACSASLLMLRCSLFSENLVVILNPKIGNEEQVKAAMELISSATAFPESGAVFCMEMTFIHGSLQTSFELHSSLCGPLSLL